MGGVEGAIADRFISAGKSRAATDRVQQLRDQIQDLDVRAMYWQALSNQVCGVPWIKVEKFDTIPDNVRPPDTSDHAAMNILSTYRISQDCRVLTIHTSLAYWMPGIHNSPSAYLPLTIYHSSEIGRTNAVEAIELWSADGAALFRKGISETIEGSVRMVRRVLECMGNTSEIPERPAQVTAVLMHAAGGAGKPVGKETHKVMVLEDTPDRLIFLLNGNAWSLPRQEVELKYLPTK
jgi:hypothetical protein